MADVVIICAESDISRLRDLARLLRRAGVTVWWPQDTPPGSARDAVAEAELQRAPAALVAWSRLAVADPFVRTHARWALERGNLLQVALEDVAPPLVFREHAVLDFRRWRARRTDAQFARLLAALRAIKTDGHPGRAPQPAARILPAVLGIAAALGSVLGLFANLDGARNFVCSIGPIEAIFERACPSPSPPAPPVDAAARAALFKQVSAVWGNAANERHRRCADTFRYTVERRVDQDILVLSRAGKRYSEAVIYGVGPGTLATRTLTPAADADQTWELELSLGRLTQRDNKGVATPLVSCGR